ncbi:MAG: rRNA maturation RNase YbeY [Candidatus Andersenbacteria bacterium]|nr:rRNA maturation RNase YbeY [Candidatus Andersenbacteria bacterium]MCK4591915.1 rRNA maturation RNase YbeY [Candidatus Parcubacteria bacterium]
MSLPIKNFTKNKLNQKYLNEIAERTLEVAKFKKPVEISLVITGEKRIKSLNKKYRKIDKITDVLSFGNEEFVGLPDKIIYLGEVFICYPQAVRQAKQKKHLTKKELAILLIHGILHLLGYDHKGNYENSEMKILEKKILTVL